jgi:hypothetical protein
MYLLRPRKGGQCGGLRFCNSYLIDATKYTQRIRTVGFTGDNALSIRMRRVAGTLYAKALGARKLYGIPKHASVPDQCTSFNADQFVSEASRRSPRYLRGPGNRDSQGNRRSRIPTAGRACLRVIGYIASPRLLEPRIQSIARLARGTHAESTT